MPCPHQRPPGIRSVLWFLPTTGDSRYVGSEVGARSPTFEYLTQVARAADPLGYDGLLIPSGRWCDDPWVCTTAVAPFTRHTDFLIALPGVELAHDRRAHGAGARARAERDHRHSAAATRAGNACAGNSRATTTTATRHSAIAARKCGP